VIEPTDEMVHAFDLAMTDACLEESETRRGLAAVLAIVERDREEQRRQLADALEAVQRAIATDSRDWGQARGDAWLWGVLVGWDCEESHDHEMSSDCEGAMLDEVATQHGWTAAQRSRIKELRRAIREAAARDR